jgi:hypothetical protein
MLMACYPFNRKARALQDFCGANVSDVDIGNQSAKSPLRSRFVDQPLDRQCRQSLPAAVLRDPITDLCYQRREQI